LKKEKIFFNIRHILYIYYIEITLWHSRHNSASLGHLLGEKLLLLLLLGIVATARASILTHSIRQTVELTCEQIKTR